MRTVTRCLLVLVLSSSVTLAVVPTSGLAKGTGISSVRKALTNVGKGVMRWPQAAVIALALLTTAPAVVNAQEAQEEPKLLLEEDEIQWLDVAEAHHSATIALQSMPVEEDEEPRVYEVAYIGDTDRGDTVVAGILLNDIPKDVPYAAYSTDGLLAENLQVEEIAFFDIGVDGFSETSVLGVKGLSLAARYEPLQFANFPFDDVGGELTMVTYWSGEEEDFPFPVARLRTCEIGENPAWQKFGVGVTTCSPVTAFGSVIFYGARGVGFHGGVLKELIFAEGISDDFLKLVRGLQGKDILPVDPHHKLPVMWGELKKRH